MSSILEKIKKKQLKEKAKRKVKQKRVGEKLQNRSERIIDKALLATRAVSKQDYEKWVRGFVKKQEHESKEEYAERLETQLSFYEKSFGGPQERFRIIPPNTTIDLERGLYGAYSLDFIVMKGGNIIGKKGHCDIYYMEGYSTNTHRVRVYSDLEIE